MVQLGYLYLIFLLQFQILYLLQMEYFSQMEVVLTIGLHQLMVLIGLVEEQL